VDEAVDAALLVFWSKGYDATTLDDLTSAVGIRRGSLYAAFGSKEALFGRALARYSDTVGNYLDRALDQPTARGVIEAVWNGAVAATTGTRTPRGCLIVHGALGCAGDVHDRLTAIRRGDQEKLRQRFVRAAAENDLPRQLDPGALASYVTTVQHGIAVQARSGADRTELRGMVDLALANLTLPADAVTAPA
jgi:AcrR family transcriptional regulator